MRRETTCSTLCRGGGGGAGGVLSGHCMVHSACLLPFKPIVRSGASAAKRDFDLGIDNQGETNRPVITVDTRHRHQRLARRFATATTPNPNSPCPLQKERTKDDPPGGHHEPRRAPDL